MTENDQSSNTCQSFRINVKSGGEEGVEAKITKSVVLQQIFIAKSLSQNRKVVGG